MKNDKNQLKKEVTPKVQPSNLVAPLVAPSGSQPATDFLHILDRMKQVVGVESDTALAKALGLRQSSISSAKARKQVPPTWAVQVAADYGVSLDWLMFGVEDKATKYETEQSLPFPEVSQPQQRSPLSATEVSVPQKSYDISDLVAKTIQVLQSDSIFRTALTSNIEAFHHGVEIEDRINDLEKRMHEKMDAAMTGIQSQLNEIVNANETLRQENKELQNELNRCSREEDLLGDTG